MESIINFYKELDTINLIIFWGIVIVIILIIILIIIMISKRHKMKKLTIKQKVTNNNINYEEELPIKQETKTMENIIHEEQQIPIAQETIISTENENKSEEHTEKNIPATKKELNDIFMIQPKDNVFEKEIKEVKVEPEQKESPKSLEMPTGPYQRNVLREMSLSQTSPIGINRKDAYEVKKREMIDDLSTSLNYQSNAVDDNDNINQTIKKELTNIANLSSRKTEVINKPKDDLFISKQINIPVETEEEKKEVEQQIQMQLPKELLELPSYEKDEISSKDKYLEEVSKKLSEAEVYNDIERTNYEIQQEEDAIISYTELMEKKDQIQTIDEEDAVISIEELMNRENNKIQESSTITDSRLYNLNEHEENDDFIKELKQFRNDL